MSENDNGQIGEGGAGPAGAQQPNTPPPLPEESHNDAGGENSPSQPPLPEQAPGVTPPGTNQGPVPAGPANPTGPVNTGPVNPVNAGSNPGYQNAPGQPGYGPGYPQPGAYPPAGYGQGPYGQGGYGYPAGAMPPQGGPYGYPNAYATRPPAPSVLANTFDMTFTKFITPVAFQVIYRLGIAATALWWLFLVIQTFIVSIHALNYSDLPFGEVSGYRAEPIMTMIFQPLIFTVLAVFLVLALRVVLEYFARFFQFSAQVSKHLDELGDDNRKERKD